MYCEHFGFSEKPFEMTPDPKYLYLSPNHREVLASLVYGIRDRRGFITIVGEVGTGKTTLLKAAQEQLDEKTKATYIFNTSVAFEEILATALLELGLKKSDESLSKTQAIDRLNKFAIKQLAAGGNVAFIIDEAQNLDTRSIENLRLLSNLETRKHKLIQLVIAGQPELDAILRRHDLRQLTQRINLKRYVTPLSEKETKEYIRHRLAVAEYKGSHLFDRRAQQLIWEYSHGIPRKINILCDNALLNGYGVKKKRITASLMEEAIKDLSWSPFAPASESPAQIPSQAIEKRRQVDTRPRTRRLTLAAVLAFTAAIIFGVGLILGHSGLDWRENISRLSQRVFQSQKISHGGGAGKIPVTTLPDDTVQGSTTQGVEAEGSPAESVKTDPLPPKKVEAEPVAIEKVEAASVPTKKVETAHVLSEEVDAVRVSAENVAADGAPAAKVGSAPPVAATQANSLPESIGTSEQTNEKSSQIALKETTRESDAPPALELPRQRLLLKMSIRPGDTLAAIIRQYYGSYNAETLRAVLHENPAIQNPDRILAGEILKLPQLSEKP